MGIVKMCHNYKTLLQTGRVVVVAQIAVNIYAHNVIGCISGCKIFS